MCWQDFSQKDKSINDGGKMGIGKAPQVFVLRPSGNLDELKWQIERRYMSGEYTRKEAWIEQGMLTSEFGKSARRVVRRQEQLPRDAELGTDKTLGDVLLEQAVKSTFLAPDEPGEPCEPQPRIIQKKLVSLMRVGVDLIG